MIKVPVTQAIIDRLVQQTKVDPVIDKQLNTPVGEIPAYKDFSSRVIYEKYYSVLSGLRFFTMPRIGDPDEYSKDVIFMLQEGDVYLGVELSDGDPDHRVETFPFNPPIPV